MDHVIEKCSQMIQLSNRGTPADDRTAHAIMGCVGNDQQSAHGVNGRLRLP
jgi:hypothetical protein